MTILNPPIAELGAAVTAPSVRRAATGFVRGEGLLNATDLRVTGDPSILAMNVSAGGYMIQLPDGSYDCWYSDAPEQRTFSAPSSGVRYDTIYLSMKSEEFGDDVSFNELVYLPNQTSSTTPPAPPAIAGSAVRATVRVPSTATKGTDCTITMVGGTTAPARDGGYTGNDVNFPTQPYLAYHRSGLGAGGNVVAHNGCPFTPAFVMCVGTWPRSGQYRPTTFIPDMSSFSPGRYEGWWFGPDGDPLVGTPGVGYAEWTAICFPGNLSNYPPS